MSEDNQLESRGNNDAGGGRISRLRVLTTVAILLVTLPGLFIVIFGGFLWWKTFGMTREFIVAGGASLLSAETPSLLDKLMRLDISTVSALIILFVGWYLFLAGVRTVVILSRAGWRAYFARTYSYSVFPQGFDEVCVRLGLVGTLVSFVIIATILFDDPVKRATPSDYGDAAVANAVNTASMDVSAALAGPSMANASVSAAGGQRSQDVFLLLCASLYSTLVGALAGYFLVPRIEWVADWAAGRGHLTGRTPEDGEAQFMQHVSNLSGMLQTLHASLQASDGFGRDLAEASKNANDLVTQLKALPEEVRQAVDGGKMLNQSAEKMSQAAGSIVTAAGAAENQSSVITSTVNQMKQEIENNSLGLSKALEETITVTKGFREGLLEPVRQLVDALQNKLATLLDLGQGDNKLIELAVENVKLYGEQVTKTCANIEQDVSGLKSQQAEIGKQAEDAEDLAKAQQIILDELKDLPRQVDEKLNAMVEEIREEQDRILLALADGSAGAGRNSTMAPTKRGFLATLWAKLFNGVKKDMTEAGDVG